jgi:hypothetical protein
MKWNNWSNSLTNFNLLIYGYIICQVFFLIYENPAEYPAIYGKDKCESGGREMQSPSKFFMMPRLLRQGASLC